MSNNSKQFWAVGQYDLSGKRIATISGMGRNKGTWDSTAESKRTAQRWAAECRRDDKNHLYRVEDAV